ncbi:hypothetical protein WR25_03104 [Diploscapter pachys]|uniref:Uncharacterized protein n=1 Tax=Diploscapter pachys TaxID=2018661 RepID=A0A2A2M2T8_9BILA|nr:hypothetical protein WR25_03104 [Diploscapter pachys]
MSRSAVRRCRFRRMPQMIATIVSSAKMAMIARCAAVKASVVLGIRLAPEAPPAEAVSFMPQHACRQRRAICIARARFLLAGDRAAQRLQHVADRFDLRRHNDLWRAKRSGEEGGAGQAEQAVALGGTGQPHVEPFGGEPHRAGAAQLAGAGVDDHRRGVAQAVRHLQPDDHATQTRAFALPRQQRASGIEAQRRSVALRQRAVAHHETDAAVGPPHRRTDRIAPPGQARARCDPPGEVAAGAGQRRNARAAQPHIDRQQRAGRPVALVDAQAALGGAIGEHQRQRRNVEPLVVERQDRRQRAHRRRSAAADHARDAERYAAVGLADLAEVDPRIGHDMRADRAFARRGFRATFVGGEITEIEAVGGDGAVQFRPTVLLVDRDMASDVRLADRALQVVDDPFGRVVAHMRGQRDGLRAEQARFDHCVDQAEVRGACGDVQRHRIGIERHVGAALGAHRQPVAVDRRGEGPRAGGWLRDRGAVERDADGYAADCAIALGAQALCVGRDLHHGAAAALVVAIADGGVADRQPFEVARRAAAFRLTGPRPVGTAVGIAHQCQLQPLRDDIARAEGAGQQRPDGEGDPRFAQGQEVAGASPARLRDRHVANADRRREADRIHPVHRPDHHRSAEALGQPIGDHALQHAIGKGRDDQQQHQRHRDEDRHVTPAGAETGGHASGTRRNAIGSGTVLRSGRCRIRNRSRCPSIPSPRSAWDRAPTGLPSSARPAPGWARAGSC